MLIILIHLHVRSGKQGRSAIVGGGLFEQSSAGRMWRVLIFTGVLLSWKIGVECASETVDLDTCFVDEDKGSFDYMYF
jgi:hypothetical protein